MSVRPSATFARATNAYDHEHEQALIEAITTALFDASKVSDCNAIVLRTGEAAQRLTDGFSIGTLAMSPSATRSPTAIRKLGDDIVKRLRRKVTVAEQSPDLKDFVRRSFWGNDEGGHA